MRVVKSWPNMSRKEESSRFHSSNPFCVHTLCWLLKLQNSFSRHQSWGNEARQTPFCQEENCLCYWHPLPFGICFCSWTLSAKRGSTGTELHKFWQRGYSDGESILKLTSLHHFPRCSAKTFGSEGCVFSILGRNTNAIDCRTQ